MVLEMITSVTGRTLNNSDSAIITHNCVIVKLSLNGNVVLSSDPMFEDYNDGHGPWLQ
jgi:hypothetical protein